MKFDVMKNNYSEHEIYYFRKEAKYYNAFNDFINWLKKIFS